MSHTLQMKPTLLAWLTWPEWAQTLGSAVVFCPPPQCAPCSIHSAHPCPRPSHLLVPLLGSFVYLFPLLWSFFFFRFHLGCHSLRKASQITLPRGHPVVSITNPCLFPPKFIKPCEYVCLFVFCFVFCLLELFW